MEISEYNKPKSINIVNKETKIIKEFKSVEEFSDYLLDLNKELYFASYFYNESIYGLTTRIWFSKGELITSELFTDKTFSLNLKEKK
jgi:hypothetical protein